MPKYKLIKDKESSLYRIQALDYINTINGYKISPGDYGGLVSSAENLDQEGNCWITYNAKVIDNAFVAGNAVITGNAVVSENAQVFDNVIVYNDAYIYGHATLSGNARIYNYAQIFDHAIIADNAEIHHYVQVFKNGCVVGNAILNGDVQFTGMVANTIDKSNEIKINHLNTEIMATQSKSEEKKEATKKNFVGSAFEKDTYKAPNGLEFKMKVPEYGIVLDGQKISELNADKAGNIVLSIYHKANSDELKKENKPTCYIAENTSAANKVADKFSIKDIIVNKEELMKFSKQEQINNSPAERIYINIDAQGKIVPIENKYNGMELPKQITGIGYNDKHLKGQNFGSAYQQSSNKEDGHAWYMMNINVDRAQSLPADENGNLNFSLILNKAENKKDNAPTNYIVFNPEPLTGRAVGNSIKEFSINKEMLLNNDIALNTTISVDGVEKTRKVAFLNISEDNDLLLNKSKYPSLVENGIVVKGSANNIDREKRREAKQEKITKQEVKEVKTEKAAPKKRTSRKIS